MVKLKCGFIVFLILKLSILHANIYCPSSKTLACYDNATNLSVTGIATAPSYSSSLIKYYDTKTFNQCNTGTINRLWYLDINNDNIFQSTETNCTQIITVISNGAPIEVYFPKDTSYNCKDAIKSEKPTWISGPCDVMGYSVSESIFEVNGAACYKILRKYTVINWCSYSGSPNGQNVWTHTQQIKIEEKNPPLISDCNNKIIGLESDCKASFIVSNSAFDDNTCASKLLSWTAEIDLWSDGNIDFKYGFTQSGEFRIEPTENGKEVSLTLPVRIGAGKHKVKWSVRDQCSNFSACHITVETKDTKKPTPYIHDFITSAFQGNIMGIMVPARLFDAGSYDNCSPQKSLKFSFSTDINDTIRTVDCTNAGFQFYTIHVTDQSGNFETVDAFMLAFDNGTCFGGRSLNGKVTETDGSPLQNVTMMLKRSNQKEIATTSGLDGNFNWGNISIFDDYVISGIYHHKMEDRVDIADLKMLQDFIFGLKKPENFEWIAADVDGDKKIRISDLDLLKEKILHPEKDFNNSWNFSYSKDSIKSNSDLKNSKNELQIKELRGKINVKAVYAGDISDANTKTTTVRNKITFVKKVIGNQIDFYPTTELNISGLELNIILPRNKENINIHSDYFEIAQTSNTIDYSKNLYRFILLKDIQVGLDKPLFSIKTINENGLQDINININSKILLQNYKTYRIESVNKNFSEPKISISPNPSAGIFYLSDPDAQISEVSDISGKKIAFKQIEDKLEIQSQPGIFLIKLQMNGLSQIKKIIKL